MKITPTPEKISFPYPFTERNVTVKIYRTSNNGHESFFVDWKDAKGPHRKRCSSFPKAKILARAAVQAILEGKADTLHLTNSAVTEHMRAKDSLKPFPGVTLDMACQEWAAAKKIDPTVYLPDVMKFYLENRTDKLPASTSVEIMNELLAALKADGKTSEYIRTLGVDLRSFTTAFPSPLWKIKRKEIEEYLRERYPLESYSPVTRNNARNSIRTLFSYGVDRGYLPEDKRTEATKLSKAKVSESAVTIYTPEEMGKILRRLDKEHIWNQLWYALLGGFAGLRRSEIEKLQWADIDLDAGHIKLPKHITKVLQRRIVPIQPNLKAWLEKMPLHARSGSVITSKYSHDGMKDQMIKDVKLTDGTIEKGVLRKDNAFRHSYCSYRLAILKNVNEACEEVGNQPNVFKKNYRELVTEAQGKDWFSITPDSVKA